MLACLTAVCLLPGRAEAGGIATDTLTVKVGYYGMDSSRYVEAGTYHGTELQENLTMYYEAHTFFRPTGGGRLPGGGGLCLRHPHRRAAGVYPHPSERRTVGAVRYTGSGRGAFTSFTRSELFRPRYYFEDLPAHLMSVYDEKGGITGEPGDGARVLYFKKERDE